MKLVCGRFVLDCSSPLIMGVLNVTPDSFSDGGRFLRQDAALDHALRMVDEGADLIDIGGESTRPGAQPASLGEERERVLPVLEVLRERVSVPISVDTRKPALMVEAIGAGADMINDVGGFGSAAAIAAVADAPVAVCAMHMRGEPRSMQSAPVYEDVLAEVGEFLLARRDGLLDAGVAADRIVLDPGFGFGKSLEHNLALLRGLSRFVQLGCPVLVGLSRKSMLGTLLDRPVEERMVASVAAALLAVERGARLVRVHDVAQTRDALRLWSAVM